jgi:hypothetical protein
MEYPIDHRVTNPIMELVLDPTPTHVYSYDHFGIRRPDPKNVDPKKEEQQKKEQSIARSNLVNLYKRLSPCDTSNVDYTNGGSLPHNLEPLSVLFCDNIVFYYYFPDNEKYAGRERNTIAKEHLALNTLKIKRLLAENDIDVGKNNIKPLGVTEKNDKYTHIEGYLIQRIKVAMPDVPLEKIIELITSRDRLTNLEEQGIHLSDVDFTRDYKGLINKRKLVEHLLKSGRFAMEGHPGEREYTILNNGKYVSNNCLTFIGEGKHGTIRFKLYNKFVQSAESPGVRDTIGNHLADWCNNPHEILRNSISNCLDTGLLRLEITYYYSSTPTEAYFRRMFTFLESILPEDQLYYNSISTQWTELLNVVSCNMLLWDVANKLAFLGYYHNALTGKVNGAFISTEDINVISNVIKMYTFNVPIAVISFEYNDTDRTILFNSKMYTKQIVPTGRKKLFAELVTCLTTGDKKLQCARKLEGYVDPKDRGLVAPTVNLVYSPKSVLKIQTHNVNIKLLNMESTIIFPQLPKKLVKAITTVAEINTEEVTRRNKEREEKYRALKDKIKEDRDRVEIYSSILRAFEHSIYGAQVPLTIVPDTTILSVRAVKFVEIQTSDGDKSTVSLFARIGDNTEYNIVKGNTFITKYCIANKDKWCLIAVNIYAVLDTNCFIIRKIGNSSYKGNLYAVVEIEDNTTVIRETKKTEEFIRLQKEKINMQLVEEKIEVTSCTKLETAIKDGEYKVGDILDIHSYWHFRKSYLLRVSKDGQSKYIVANTFLRSIIQDFLSSSSRLMLSVVIGEHTYNPISKKKEHAILTNEDTKKIIKEDIIEGEKKRLERENIRREMEKYGEVIEIQSGSTEMSTALNTKIAPSTVLRTGTEFKVVARLCIGKHYLKLEINGAQEWIQAKGIASEITKLVDNDHHVAYTYRRESGNKYVKVL